MFDMGRFFNGAKLLIFVMCILPVSCKKDAGSNHVTESDYCYDTSVFTKSRIDSVVRSNPYSIKNMQAAYDSLNVSLGLPLEILEPTDLYLKFTPSDSTELTILEDLGYELFAYPLDDSDYAEPSDSAQCVYCTIPYCDVLPCVRHEILDTCYIPSIENITMASDNYPNPVDHYSEMLERLAYHFSGNDDLVESVSARSMTQRYGPSGVLKVQDQFETTLVPLGRTKVVANSFVRLRITYTDEQGRFQFPESFVNQPKIRCKTQTQDKGRVYRPGGFCGILPAEHVFHNGIAYGGDFEILRGADCWSSAYVMACYIDYLRFCEQNAMIKPLSDLRIAIIDNPGYGGGAPMLRHLTLDQNTTQSESACYNLLRLIGGSSLYQNVSLILPDVVISSRSDISNTVFHELIHASHFANGGYKYWLLMEAQIVENYFNHVTPDFYGSGLLCNTAQNFIELTESIAYSCADYNSRTVTSDSIIVDNSCDTLSFFYKVKDTVTELLKKEIISIADLVTSTSDAKDIDELCSCLCKNNHSHALEIMTLFHKTESLLNETDWIVKNESDYDILISLTKGEHFLNKTLHSGEQFVMTGGPGNLGFDDIKTDLLCLYPSSIEMIADNRVIFRQYNGMPQVMLPRPFFYTFEWNFTSERAAFRGRRVNKYTFTLTNDDVQI